MMQIMEEREDESRNCTDSRYIKDSSLLRYVIADYLMRQQVNNVVNKDNMILCGTGPHPGLYGLYAVAETSSIVRPIGIYNDLTIHSVTRRRHKQKK
jgi:hypothetical protein